MHQKFVLGILLVAILLSIATSPQISFAASLWDDLTIPATESFNDSVAYEMGVRFQSSTAGYITGIRYYKGSENTGLHYGTLWTNAGTKVADGIFTNETSSGWQQLNFAKPVKIDADTTYVASYYTGVGKYAVNANYFSSAYTNAPLTALINNGVFRITNHLFPNSTSGNGANYWIDVVFETSVTAPATTGSGPLLVITTTNNSFTTYLSEILRAEGLNEFATADISDITAELLADYDTTILGEMTLTSTQADMFTDWVTAGGNLIAMRPDTDLSALLGITTAAATLNDGYIKVATSSAPGTGIVGDTMQYHSTADKYTLNGATAVATLYSDASTATTNPAVTIRDVGSNGGQAAAFMYDLAKSVIYTRQGNPAYESQERDGESTGIIRANDLFYPDYLNLDKVHIPQADEQQRLLANMIISMNLNKKPLPRFWYLPSMKKAALLYAIDDHNTANGTETAFNTLISNSAANCSTSAWECLRGTSWLYNSAGLSNEEALTFHNQGFEMGSHPQGCNNCTPYTYNAQIAASFTAFQAIYTNLPEQGTSRFHAIPWNDWASHARIEREHNVRFDMNYYYFPPAWTGARPGFMTGSGFPMKFGAIDGSVIDVYQQETHFTNDNQLVNTQANIAATIDRALGGDGFYGIFGTHDDRRDTATLSAYLNVVNSRDISMVSAKQVLDWVDGRNNSLFSNFSWSNNKLTFDISAAAGASNLYALLPESSSSETITSLKKNGTTLSYTTETIKGISYVYFPATTGTYEAQYGTIAATPTETVALTPTSTPTPATAATTSVSSQASSDPNTHSGWKYTIATGPNFVGIADFISGHGETSLARAFINSSATPIDLTVSITKPSGIKLIEELSVNPFPWMQGFNTVSEIFKFEALSAFNGYPLPIFTEPVTIILPYDPSKVAHILPSQLRVAWYNPARKQWQIVGNRTIVDTTNHTVSTTTRQFSHFAVVYQKGRQAVLSNKKQQVKQAQEKRLTPSITTTPKKDVPKEVKKTSDETDTSSFWSKLKRFFKTL